MTEKISIRAALWLKSWHILMVYFQFSCCSPGDANPLITPFLGVAGGHGRSWWAETRRWVGRLHLSRVVNCFYYRYLDGTGKEFKAANLKEVVLLWHPCKLRQVLQGITCCTINAPPAWPQTREVRLAVTFPFTFPHISKPTHNILQTQLAFSAECPGWGQEGKKKLLS